MPALKEIPVQIQAIGVVPDADRFRQELKSKVEGEVRFDPVSRALYSTDASVYQIQPVGVVFPRNREDICAAWRFAGVTAVRLRCAEAAHPNAASRSGPAYRSILRNTTTACWK
jgi:hypothetical protein